MYKILRSTKLKAVAALPNITAYKGLTKTRMQDVITHPSVRPPVRLKKTTTCRLKAGGGSAGGGSAYTERFYELSHASKMKPRPFKTYKTQKSASYHFIYETL